MNWPVKKGPHVGDTRCRVVFFWLPDLINGRWYWLERRLIEEYYTIRYWWQATHVIGGRLD